MPHSGCSALHGVNPNNKKKSEDNEVLYAKTGARVLELRLDTRHPSSFTNKKDWVFECLKCRWRS